MKRIVSFYFVLFALSLVVWSSCGDMSAKRREPRSVYMADMYESRSYQSQTESEFYQSKIGNRRPKGVIARGEVAGYDLPNTDEGYALSAGVKSPIVSLDSVSQEKAKLLYAYNCEICHGAKMDGNGTLYKDGEGPYPAKPATLVGDAKYEAMSEGTMVHSIYYGKNLMGAYSSQLTQKEIWMVVYYIKSQQKKSQANSTMATATTK